MNDYHIQTYRHLVPLAPFWVLVGIASLLLAGVGLWAWSRRSR